MSLPFPQMIMRRGKLALITIAIAGFWTALASAAETGLDWPTDRLLPAFAEPAPVLDCINLSSVSEDESDLFTSLQGIVNRTQPRIACVLNGQEGAYTWLDLHNLRYTVTNAYGVLQKYKTSVTGLVVTDPSVPDTLNLATTIAGVDNRLICAPSLLPALTNAPYNFQVTEDLRGRFTDKYQVYRYLYSNYWSRCSHRVLTGLNPGLHGNFRDYAVAVQSAVVWLDPSTVNTTDQSILSLFLANMPANKSIYLGWWPSEANGLNWIAQYGVPVLASDFYVSGTVYSGVKRPVNVPEIPPVPPLENKVYVSLILSDGDNIQYMQHVMRMRWGSPVRGSIPIGWTVTPLAADMDPMMLNYYWSTASTNDCLISGPSGAGYTHMQRWNSGNLAGFAKITDPYLRRSGVRVITIWDQVTTAAARAFATNCPTLLGLTDQSGGSYTTVNLGLRTLGLAVSYSSSTNSIISGITSAAQSWNGTAPLFIAAQANTWDLQPADLAVIASTLDTNKYKLVRPDHLFMLHNRVFGKPQAATKPAASVTAGTATLRAMVTPEAPNATAWFEWGTNPNYGFKSATTSLMTGRTVTPVNANIIGLSAGRTYHYRVVASNTFGMTWGADRVLTTGGRVQVWGDGSLGETNVPANLTNAVAIAAGATHALTLKTDRTVSSWGSNSFGQTNVPAGLSEVIEVAGGQQHSLALLANGTVMAWGDNVYGQTNLPAGLSNVRSIASGSYHNLALLGNGTVVAWGYNAFGQTNVPPGLSNVVSIAAGLGHSMALKADGTVVCWGQNNAGQTNVPPGLSQVISIAAGQYHSVALKSATASASDLFPARRWVADSLEGVDGTAISNWVDVAAGRNAIQTTASRRPRLYSNALNGHKVVRFSSASSQHLTVSSTESPISAAGSFTLIVVFKTSTPGNASSSFYQNTGLLGCEQPNVVADWALCLNGSQLGAGLGGGASGCGADLSLYGGNVTDGNAHISMYVRSGETLSLYVDGVRVAHRTSLCTGARGNYSFQIGAMTASTWFFNGDIAEIQIFDRALTAQEINSANQMLAASYGVGGAAGQVVAWGNNSNGQATVPKGLTGVTAITAGNAFNLALMQNGTITGWGNSSQGQTSVPAGLTNVTAIAGGLNFGLAIGNQPPRALSATIPGYVDHDLVFTLPVSNPDGNTLDYRIVSLPTAGELFQYSGGTRGAPITAITTSVMDPAGRLIFAPASGSTGNPYATFQFVVDDGLVASAPAQVTIQIGLPSVPNITGLSWTTNNPWEASYTMNFTGDANATYQLWATTNLVNWEKIGTAIETAPGQYQFIDAAAEPRPQKFFRITAGQ